jgi:threonine dehydrogenase-like Zn-dependent dehydrogenase
MKAILFDGELMVVEVPKPLPGPGEALIRVRMAGICATDIEIMKGYLGFRGIIGHEFTGIVEEMAGHVPGMSGKRARGLESAMKYTRPRGTIILKSTVAEAIPVDLAPIVINEVTIIGSRCGPFEPAIRALGDGSIDVKPLITAQFPAADAGEAFAAARKKDSLKVLIDFR